jgi:hypothetical protein
MKFTEFANKQKNVIKAGLARRVSSSIPISESREAFFSGKSFKKYDNVESSGKLYRIVEQCSNYFKVVDETGNVHRKFQDQLTLSKDQELNIIGENSFHGYEFKKPETKELFESLFDAEADNDDIGIIKQIKEHDMKQTYTKDEQMEVAKVIAETFGFGINSDEPSAIIQAIAEDLQDFEVEAFNKMVDIAKDVGIVCENVSVPNYHPEQEHIQNHLAKHDINSAFDGNNIKVHKSNLWKAARHVGKMGYKQYKVVAGLNESVQVEPETESNISYKDLKNKIGASFNPTSETNRKQLVNKANGN